MGLNKKEIKMLEQAKRRMLKTLEKDKSVLSVEIPTNYRDLIKQGDYAKQIREISKVRVRTATPYGTSDVRVWGAEEAVEIVRAANIAERKNEKIKKENPELYKKLEEAGSTRRKTLGSIVVYRGLEKTVEIFRRSAEESTRKKEIQAAKNLKQSIGDPIKSVSPELWRQINKKINEKVRDKSFRDIFKSDVAGGNIKMFFSSIQETYGNLLGELLRVLGIDMDRTWKSAPKKGEKQKNLDIDEIESLLGGIIY